MTVRVKTTPGGAMIHVNDVPVPGRFFYATRGDLGFTTSDTWQEQSFDIVPFRDVTGLATLQLRFTDAPGEYFIRDIHFTDTTTGLPVYLEGSFATQAAFNASWYAWPQGTANTVGTVAVEQGALHVVIRSPADGVWPGFHLYSKFASVVKDRTYRCTLSIKGTPGNAVKPVMYAVPETGRVSYTRLGAPECPLEREIVLARDAGVRFISVAAPACWDPPSLVDDWSPLDSVIASIVKLHPQALVVPRIDLNAPAWWKKLHPETVTKYEDGTSGSYNSVSSQQYRDDVSAQVEKMCRHLCAAFPNNFGGIHPAGQSTNEWFYENAWQNLFLGYDDATRDAWRTYLQNAGQTGAATAEVPTATERHAAPAGCLRDPATEARLILFNQFWQKEMADTVLQIAAAARRGTNGTRLVLFFYGYLFEFGSMANGASNAGHYNLGRVLQSPDIDILCSPWSYYDRAWIGSGPCMSAVDSAQLHGKLWLNEDDTGTYLAKDVPSWQTRVNTYEETIDVLRRDQSQAAIRGLATWWMDLKGTGWFDDVRLWDLQRKLSAMDELALGRDRPFTPEIALVVDELSMCHLAAGATTMSTPLVYYSRGSFGRCGAPYGQYLMSDVLAGKVGAKLQVYLAAWAMSATTRQALAQVRQSDTTRVWCYAPGYIGSEKMDTAYMAELTGFSCKLVNLANPRSTPTAQGKLAGLPSSWGDAQKITPLFTIDTLAGDTILATYSDGSPSLVVRKSAHGSDVFMGTPAWTPELARTLATLAGVHVYSKTNVVLYAGDCLVSAQALQDGPVQLDVGVNGAVVEITDGSAQGQGPSLTPTLRKGETRILATSDIMPFADIAPIANDNDEAAR